MRANRERANCRGRILGREIATATRARQRRRTRSTRSIGRSPSRTSARGAPPAPRTGAPVPLPTLPSVSDRLRPHVAEGGFCRALVSCWRASALLHTCKSAPARLCQRDPDLVRNPSPDSDLVRNPSPDPWSLEAPPPSADQQQRILMERAAARAQSARSLPLGFDTFPPSLPSGFGARAQAAPPSQGNAYQRGVIRCAACLVDRYPLRLWDHVRSSHSADPRAVWNIAVDSDSGRSMDSSGEVAFLQHINGKAHAARARRRGFAGVLPNDAGLFPHCTRA